VRAAAGIVAVLLGAAALAQPVPATTAPGALPAASSSGGAPSAAAPSVAAVAAGEAIYMRGVLPSGAPLLGEREGGVRVAGAAAACVNCHRRSGLGMAEGRIVIPPVTASYLFRAHGRRTEDMDLRYMKGHELGREPYTEASLAQAIRAGVGRSGRALDFLMPRFALDEAAMASVTAYLRHLSGRAMPGVTDDTLHFATIITPDADKVKRQAMLDVLTRFFADKNDFLKGGSRPMRPGMDIAFRVTRRWALHVWELTGPPATWQAQLRTRMAAEPVFAVISGLGGRDWSPVHRFCEQAKLPCLMPNVEAPVEAEEDFYSVYLSRGVFLDAQLIGHHLDEGAPPAAAAAGRTMSVRQVFRADDVGAVAASRLRAMISRPGVGVNDIVLGANDGAEAIARAVAAKAEGESLVLWLRPADLALLPAAASRGPVYVSGTMADLERAPLPGAWREVALIAYPADLPDARRIRMNFPLNWLRMRRIALNAERVQADTYLACGLVADMVGEMLDSFIPEYLIERLETMASRWPLTAYYPRLGLSIGQRFASKGGYLVRFVEPGGTRITAASEWIVP
jgi:hypothetical protein